MSYFVVQWIPGPALLVLAAGIVLVGAAWWWMVRK